jgi:hypothetical protein
MDGWIAALLEKCNNVISETQVSRLAQNHYLEQKFCFVFPIKIQPTIEKEKRCSHRITSFSMNLNLGQHRHILTRVHDTFLLPR